MAGEIADIARKEYLSIGLWFYDGSQEIIRE